MESIQQIDKNFERSVIKRSDIKWYNATEKPFEIFGLANTYKQGIFERATEEYQNEKTINETCRRLMKKTAGGRVRFATDSTFIAIKVELANAIPFPHMPSTGHSGFDVYVGREGSSDQRYVKTFFPPDTETVFYDGLLEFNTIAPNYDSFEITLNFPLYNGVKSLYIGVKEGSRVSSPVKYKIEKPIAFYGSSVSQGGCASRPGNNYMNHISRWLESDFYNFGFSGSAQCEVKMAEFIANHELSAIVVEFDASTTVELFKERAYPFYETLRKIQPDIPMIFFTMPEAYRLYESIRKRNLCDSNAIAMDCYLKAYENDKNLYYVDGGNMFNYADVDACTVDGRHPNDLGFFCMAKTLYPVIKRAIYK